MPGIKTLNEIDPIVKTVLAGYDVGPDVADPNAILVRSAKMHDMEFGKNLRCIARAGAGVNNIPLDRCAAEGIVVFNTPGANANAVKELVFASMLMTSRNLREAIEWCKGLEGDPEAAAKVEKGKKQFVGPELKGKNMAVIGLGDVGVMVANFAYAVGMNVIGFDPFISVDHAWKLSRAVKHADSLGEALANADYITIHVPLNDKTKNYISKKELAKCKRGATLINFSRDSIVDIPAVLQALEDGVLAHYIVDFPTVEVVGKKNVITIPHLGASTPEAEENCAKMAAEEVKDYLENGNICHSVNLPNCSMPRSGGMRVCLLHKNIPNMVSKITAILSDHGANITNMMNKSRGDYAYTMLDLDDHVNHNLQGDLEQIEGVMRVMLFR